MSTPMIEEDGMDMSNADSGEVNNEPNPTPNAVVDSQPRNLSVLAPEGDEQRSRIAVELELDSEVAEPSGSGGETHMDRPESPAQKVTGGDAPNSQPQDNETFPPASNETTNSMPSKRAEEFGELLAGDEMSEQAREPDQNEVSEVPGTPVSSRQGAEYHDEYGENDSALQDMNTEERSVSCGHDGSEVSHQEERQAPPSGEDEGRIQEETFEQPPEDEYASPENMTDTSPSRLEWVRQKEEENAKCPSLDRLMCMIGLEDVKAEFLAIKARVELAFKRNEDVTDDSINLTVEGNPGTGKFTIKQLFYSLIRELLETGASSDNSRKPFLGDSNRTVKLGDYSDEELHEFLTRLLKGKGVEVETGPGSSYTSILARRIGRERNSKSFRNFSAIEDAFKAACDRQAYRLCYEQLQLKREGKQVADSEYWIFTKEDLLGKPPRDIRQTSSAYKELQAMVGLRKVKEAVEELMELSAKSYALEVQGKEPIRFNPNRMFLGPPGTGKTTVAKLLGQIICDIGLTSTPEVVLKDHGDFMAEAQSVGGERTATIEIMKEARGKVLIIDDAHSLCPSSRRSTSVVDRSFTDIWDTIVTKTSSEPGQGHCIILTGYADQMSDIFDRCNPGLRSRFPLEDAFQFSDYETHELAAILEKGLERDGIKTASHVKEVALQVLARARHRPGFGNARDVHNLVNRAKASWKKQTTDGALRTETNEIGRAAGAELVGTTELGEGIILQPEHFDPDWNRQLTASQACEDLFEDFVGFKKIVEQFTGFQDIAKGMRLHNKDPRSNIPFTFVFKGPPGTGKTSTARKLGKIFRKMGFLSSDEVIECSASDLIGQHLGHTGPLVQSYLEKALGKVLFIDEAYRLGSGSIGLHTGSSFEEEAVGELVDGLTKTRYAQKIVVILAGYSEDMDRFMKTNRGLRGRFATEVIFPQLEPDQCIQYLGRLIGEMGIIIRDREPPGTEKKDKVHRLLKKLSSTRDWSNGRDIETLAKNIIGEVFRKQGKKEVKSPRLQVSTDELIIFLQDMLRGRLAGQLQDQS